VQVEGDHNPRPRIQSSAGLGLGHTRTGGSSLTSGVAVDVLELLLESHHETKQNISLYLIAYVTIGLEAVVSVAATESS
jgi:hypothetical protein